LKLIVQRPLQTVMLLVFSILFMCQNAPQKVSVSKNFHGSHAAAKASKCIVLQ